MAAATHGSGHYTSSRKLEDQAASAALSTTTGSESRMSNHPLFDEDGKLSSASAATSLKYARPQDLPSFPSAGLHMSAAGAAASLAESNKKSFQHWKPDKIPHANMAALAARDYEMDPLWQPEMSAAGSKAAIMAHRDTLNKRAAAKANDATPAQEPTAPSPEIQKKALLAAHSAVSSTRRRSGSAPVEPAAVSSKDTSWALKAANKSHADGVQGGAFTVGDPGFEAARIQNVAKNNVNRQLYGSAPPVSIEVQEKNRQDTLRASAVAMAQKMYASQQQNAANAVDGSRTDSRAAASRVRSHTATGSASSTSDEFSSSRYENLEEAARRLAQERLAKIHDEHAEYRNYYGQKSPKRSTLSMRLRRRASSGADADDSDEEQSRKIRNQMSLFTSKLAEVDDKKRQSDRDALLQLAHRNVDAQMQRMDDRVFQETGKASPAQMEKWEKAARDKAQADSDERMKNVGKVHIGAGKYLDESEVHAIAKARLQPTLDDISDKAEKQRAKDEEERLERERIAAQAARDKAREMEIATQTKAATDKERAEEKARLDEENRVRREQAATEKEQRRAEAAEEKERRRAEAATEKERRQADAAVEKERRQADAAVVKERRQEAAAEAKERARQEKEEKRKSRDGKSRFSALLSRGGGAVAGATVGVAVGAGAAVAGAASALTSHPPATTGPSTDEPETVHDAVTHDTPTTDPTHEDTREVNEVPVAQIATPVGETTAPGEEPVAPVESKKSLDLRQSTDSRKSLELSEGETPDSPNKRSSRVRSWMKGRFGSKSNAVKESDELPKVAETADDTEPATELTEDKPRPDSIRDVAMAGRPQDPETEDMYGTDKPVSPVEPVVPVVPVVPVDPVAPVVEDHAAGSGNRSPSISSVSDAEPAVATEAVVVAPARPSIEQAESSETESRGRKGFRQRLLSKISSNKGKEKENEKTLQPAATNNTTATEGEDEFEEARDTFEEEKLAPPPPLSAVTADGAGGSKGSPTGSRERSKFTEEL